MLAPPALVHRLNPHPPNIPPPPLDSFSRFDLVLSRLVVLNRLIVPNVNISSFVGLRIVLVLPCVAVVAPDAVVSIDGVGVNECDEDPEEEGAAELELELPVDNLLNGRRRESDFGLGHEEGGTDCVFELVGWRGVAFGLGFGLVLSAEGAGKEAVCATGDDPTEPAFSPSRSLGVAVRGVLVAEGGCEDDSTDDAVDPVDDDVLDTYEFDEELILSSCESGGACACACDSTPKGATAAPTGLVAPITAKLAAAGKCVSSGISQGSS